MWVPVRGIVISGIIELPDLLRTLRFEVKSAAVVSRSRIANLPKSYRDVELDIVLNGVGSEPTMIVPVDPVGPVGAVALPLVKAEAPLGPSGLVGMSRTLGEVFASVEGALRPNCRAINCVRSWVASRAPRDPEYESGMINKSGRRSILESE
jgi:hypothetical protein